MNEIRDKHSGVQAKYQFLSFKVFDLDKAISLKTTHKLHKLLVFSKLDLFGLTMTDE